MPDNSQSVSLLSESRRKLEIKVPGENRWVFIGLAVVATVLIIWGAFQLYLKNLESNLAEFNNSIVELDRARDKKFEKELLTLDRQFGLTGELLRKHIIWSGALAKIQSLTPALSQFVGFSANAAENKLNAKVLAPSYTVIAKHIGALLSDKDKAFKDVDLNKITGRPSGQWEYDLQITFDSQKLLMTLTGAESLRGLGDDPEGGSDPDTSGGDF